MLLSNCPSFWVAPVIGFLSLSGCDRAYGRAASRADDCVAAADSKPQTCTPNSDHLRPPFQLPNERAYRIPPLEDKRPCKHSKDSGSDKLNQFHRKRVESTLVRQV